MEKKTACHCCGIHCLCGLVIFAQQKAVDLNKEDESREAGSVYDSSFRKSVESCDESEQRQIGQACYRGLYGDHPGLIGVWMRWCC